tara:strand:- start:492 stop:851 length:360 start_codon:yes stop_codon:yes gene_type:complete
MYYIKLNSNNNNELIYHCKKCGDENTELISELKNFCVSKTHFKNNANKYNNIINEYTKLDPTLPRTNKLDCPNVNCPTNNSESKTNIEKEIIYIRYDNDNMKYMYLCCVCDNIWRNDEK